MRRILFAAALACAIAASASAQEAQKGTMYMVSTAHLDSQWNWDVRTTIDEYVPATLYRNLKLLEQYPDYLFNFEGGIKYYWMKEYYPEGYAKLRDLIQSGRWHISGASWEASDANVPSPESLTRNILLGQRFYEEEFGVLSTDIFLPDCFGFGWQLPTVASHCGLIGFSSQKLQWREKPFYGSAKEPFAYGKWRGVDGSEIYAGLRMGKYSRKMMGEDISAEKEWIDRTAEYPGGLAINYYGVGDVGGSPTVSSVQSIARSVHGEGPIKIISAASDDLFKYLEANKVPVETFDGELLMDVHGTGCYTSQAAMKLFNRRNEVLADAAERSSVAAELVAGLPYASAELTDIWRRFIWHQFHDDLTGTSIPRAYEFSWNDEIISLLQSAAIEETAVGAVSSRLDTRVSGSQTPLVVYNPSAFDRQDLVTIDGSWKVTGPDGKAAKTQYLDGKTIFLAGVPATGYAVYGIKACTPSTKAGKAGVSTISNSVYTLRLDANGDISSLVDRRSGRELVESGKAIRLALTEENASLRWPAWEIRKEVIDKESRAITENVAITLEEAGPARKTIRVERTYGTSRFVQHISLYEGANADRIDIKCEVDWDSMETLLKAEFPLSVSNPQARYDLGVGSILRGNNTITAYEVYAQQWADLTDEGGAYGVSILNDCKYGWDKPADNVLRLTLLHTPKTSNFYPYQNRQDLGHHEFTYSIVGHAGEWDPAVVDKAEQINAPLTAFTATRHAGELGRKWSLLSAEGASVKAVKKAEDGDGYVVRLYETTGKAGKATLRFAYPVASAEELNGIEKPVDAEAILKNGKSITLDVKPFGIKTIRVRFDAPAAAPAAQAALELPFNTSVASYNAFRRDSGMDIVGNTYPAELIPSTLLHRGVSFPLVDGMEKNAVRCNGEQVALPAGEWDKVYLLVASSMKDLCATFEVGGLKQDVTVPFYGDFIGQWGHTGHTEGFVKDADVAYVFTHKHSSVENKDLSYDFCYLFCVALDVPKGATSIVLPQDKKVTVFSAVAAKDADRTVKAAGDLLRIAVPYAAAPQPGFGGLSVGPANVIGTSGEHSKSQKATNLVDDDRSTKWCDSSNASEKYVDFDLGSAKTISGWDILHATFESVVYTTKDFSLQVRNSTDEPWQTVDSVTGNSEAITFRDLAEPVTARYVRLSVTAATQMASGQGECGTTRIYEFMLR